MRNHILSFLFIFFSLIIVGCLPPSDPYPYAPPEEVIAEAQVISDNLETYIRAWLAGEADAQIPDELIPASILDSRDFYLKHPDEVTPEETWATRLAQPIDLTALRGGIPDPNVTYLFLGTAFAPFGTKLIVEGEFPRARFFSFQITAPLDGVSYYADRQFGGAEVSVVDVDIEPLPGHVNPFRVGADRDAEDRAYRYEFELMAGDPVALNNSTFEYPYRGANDNRRAGALMVYQGPLGYKTVTQFPVEAPGDWNLGALWLRIYQPDAAAGPLGGVPMPTVYFELSTGERFFIGSDFSRLQERADLTGPNQNKTYAPNLNFGPAEGWSKSWGITRSMLTGICQANGWSRQDSAQRVREIDLGWTGRGEFQAAPNNYEPHATTNNYCNYLGRKVDIPPGKVLVLTGKLPTFPATRAGTAEMTAAQVRYWSIVGIDEDPLSPLPATTIHAIGDEDVVIDDQRNYIIAYSNSADRPANADASNGVSWVNSGTQTQHGLLMRWVSVRDDWHTSYAPSEEALSWANSDWAGSTYDSTLIGVNWRRGHLACFLPRVHLLDKIEFENLGMEGLHAADIPVWVNETFELGPAASRLGTVTASSTFDETPNTAVANVLDGSLTTSWSSALGEADATLTLDLDSVQTISAVKFFWDFAFFPRAYTIEYSQNAFDWETLVEADGENGQIDLYSGIQDVRTRYLRILCTEANLSWYTLAELEVYTSDCDCEQLLVGSTEELPTTDETPLDFRVFPNPATETVYLKWSDDNLPNPTRVRLYDLAGRYLSESTYDPGTGLAVGHLPIGVYVVTVEVAGKQNSRRVVKQ